MSSRTVGTSRCSADRLKNLTKRTVKITLDIPET
jgi:hypothetical protein